MHKKETSWYFGDDEINLELVHVIYSYLLVFFGLELLCSSWHKYRINSLLLLTDCYCELIQKINIACLSSWLFDTKRIKWDAKLLTGLINLWKPFFYTIKHISHVESGEFGRDIVWSFLLSYRKGNFIKFYLFLSPHSKFSGKSRARDAALNAIQSPLLDIGIERATGIVWNITGGMDLTLFEVWSIYFLVLL